MNLQKPFDSGTTNIAPHHPPLHPFETLAIANPSKTLTASTHNILMALSYKPTLEEFMFFHLLDRKVYARLHLRLGFDTNQSKWVVAFWYLLERYREFHFTMSMLSLQDDTLFFELAVESLECLQYLFMVANKLAPYLNDVYSRYPRLRSQLSKELSLTMVFEDVKRSITIIEVFIIDVCERAFFDIVPLNPDFSEFQPHNGAHQPNLINGLVQEEFQNPIIELAAGDPNVVEAQNLVPAPQEAYNDDGGDQSQPNVDHNINRTLFCTFSKGHPVSEDELKTFFNWKFGDCLEEIFMKAEQNSQPLFAKVVVKSASDVAKILVGKDETGKVKFSIHGKDCFVRRYKKIVGKERNNQRAAGVYIVA